MAIVICHWNYLNLRNSLTDSLMDLKLNLYSSEVSTEEIDVSFVDTVIKAGFPSPAPSVAVHHNGYMTRQTRLVYLVFIRFHSL